MTKFSLLSVLSLLILISINAQAETETSILIPGSIVCKSYQDLVMAKEMLIDDTQLASNALHRTGRCALSDYYNEILVRIVDRKNVGYQVIFPNSTVRYWVLIENIKLSTVANNTKIIIYPASGQSVNQLIDDKKECNTFAMSQIDNYTNSTSITLVPPPRHNFESEKLGANATSGAAAGAIVGSIAGDASSGAGIGMIAGTLFGGIERAQRDAEEAVWQRQYEAMQNYHLQEQSNQITQSKKQYYFSYISCLESRGYTVN
jgi:hypothetical protein